MTTLTELRQRAEAQGHDTNCDVNDDWSSKPCNCGHAALLEEVGRVAQELHSAHGSIQDGMAQDNVLWISRGERQLAALLADKGEE